jgi:Protein of unknown function (DUF2750)
MASLKPEEISKIFKKTAEKRYEYFIKTVADTEEVYGLADEEGWALLGDEENEELDIIPFFPGADFAERFRVEGGFDEYQIGVLDANELLEWLDDMEEEGTMVAVFPDLSGSGLVAPPAKLKTDLMEELDKYDEEGRKIK